MSTEVALLYDVWEGVKDQVPQKERLHTAENIVRSCDDNVDISDAENNLHDFDKVMQAAIVSHFDIGFEDENEDEDWET